MASVSKALFARPMNMVSFDEMPQPDELIEVRRRRLCVWACLSACLCLSLRASVCVTRSTVRKRSERQCPPGVVNGCACVEDPSNRRVSSTTWDTH